MHLFEILFVGILQRFPATVFMLTLRVDCVGLAVKADILMAGVTYHDRVQLSLKATASLEQHSVQDF